MYSNAWITALDGYIYNNVAISGLSTNLFWSGHTAFPGRTGNQTSNEASYTGYSRVSSPRGDTSIFTLSGNEVVTAANIQLPKQTDAGTDVLTFWGLGTLTSGTGTLIRMGTFGGAAPRFFTAAVTDLIQDLDGHGLSAGDRVVLYQIADDRAFPTGPTEGTVYYVITDGLTSTDFKVSTTSEGAAVDVTVAGVGRWQKCEPVQMGLNVAPTIESGARFITA